MKKYFAFVDETQEGRYRLCIISVNETHVYILRKTLKELRLSGQRRIHMSKESDRRKKLIIETLCGIDGWQAYVVASAPRRRVTPDTRQELFLLAAQHPFWSELNQVVIEDSNERVRDKKTLAWLVAHGQHRFSYRFEKPSHDAGLWAADIVGWAVAKGGSWKTPLAERLTVLTAP
ncbi:MAG: hypothetical protein ACKOUD_01690 [Rhodoluna sp.]